MVHWKVLTVASAILVIIGIVTVSQLGGIQNPGASEPTFYWDETIPGLIILTIGIIFLAIGLIIGVMAKKSD
ncbi:MAG: hypothetical protein KAW45_05025 [Thermoplasmatales archaeon]|nr:hypothetical protein [Thermoplasmatales archaeon]